MGANRARSSLTSWALVAARLALTAVLSACATTGAATVEPVTNAVALENERSGLVWTLFASNPNIRRAIANLNRKAAPTPTPTPSPNPTPSPTPSPTPTPSPAPTELVLEAENGSGNGSVMQRSQASGGRTVWLHAGKTRTLDFQQPAAARYTLAVRYSNDNFGPLETVEVRMDGSLVGRFEAKDTRDFGAGWNVFEWADIVGTVDLSAAAHRIAIGVSGGDGYGVEIDVVCLRKN